MFKALCEKVHDSCRDRSITEDELLTLLEACEWYPEVFTDDNGNEIPDMLEYIADWLEKTVNGTADKEPDTMTYVAVLAKFSYLYQKYDVQYATQCLQHASAIYTKLAAASGRDAEKFMALTELYRAAGLPSYRSQILEYKEFFEDNTSYLEETAYLYGSMTYLATRQSVDIDLCTAFMEGIRDQGEELAKRCRDFRQQRYGRSAEAGGGTGLCQLYLIQLSVYGDIGRFPTLSDGKKQRFRVLLSGRGKNVGLSSSDRPTGLPHRKTLDLRSVLCF